MTQALWRAHVDRALAAARRLRAGWPMPGLAARDPIAVRALVLILLVATFFAAGGDRTRRVATAFNWQGVVAPSNYRIDAWVTPPQYTGRPPVILPGLRPGEPARANAPILVPAGSVLLIRASGANGLDVGLAWRHQGRRQARQPLPPQRLPQVPKSAATSSRSRAKSLCAVSATRWSGRSRRYPTARRRSRSPRIPSRNCAVR